MDPISSTSALFLMLDEIGSQHGMVGRVWLPFQSDARRAWYLTTAQSQEATFCF